MFHSMKIIENLNMNINEYYLAQADQVADATLNCNLSHSDSALGIYHSIHVKHTLHEAGITKGEWRAAARK